ncbi:MAG: hypothetical protein AABW51_02800 [Nanoarchaeota archaeon]
MINEQFKDAIKVVYERLDNNTIGWALIGSTNLALQGMDLSPKDLDLVMKLDSLVYMPMLFSDYSTSRIEELKPDNSDPAWTAKLQRHPAFNVHFNIGRVPVQILGEYDDGDYVSKLINRSLCYTKIGGLKIPSFTLETEADIYAETYRYEKAERIRCFLAQRTIENKFKI